MSSESVTFYARCDGCPGVARWCGVKNQICSGTEYRITCPSCGTAPREPVELRKQPRTENVQSNEARALVNDYWQRLTGWRTA